MTRRGSPSQRVNHVRRSMCPKHIIQFLLHICLEKFFFGCGFPFGGAAEALACLEATVALEMTAPACCDDTQRSKSRSEQLVTVTLPHTTSSHVTSCMDMHGSGQLYTHLTKFRQMYENHTKSSFVCFPFGEGETIGPKCSGSVFGAIPSRFIDTH